MNLRRKKLAYNVVGRQRSSEEIQELIDEHFGPWLADTGFTATAPRRWVRSIKAPIREVVEIKAFKGATYVPVWGVSLDFVPHLSGTKFAPHRTEKSALLDLPINASLYKDRYPHHRLKFSQFAPTEQRRWRRDPPPDVDVSAKAAQEHATAWFERISDLESLRSVFDEALTPASGFYVQPRLAYAFLLGVLGHGEQSDEELDRWLLRFGKKLSEPDLRDLRTKAIAEYGRLA